MSSITKEGNYKVRGTIEDIWTKLRPPPFEKLPIFAELMELIPNDALDMHWSSTITELVISMIFKFCNFGGSHLGFSKRTFLQV